MRRSGEQTILNQLAKQGMIPVTPALKNNLRFSQKWSSNAIPHEFFGTLRGNRRIRSKISLSWAYRTSDPHQSQEAEWEIRGWCYLPPYIRPTSQKEIKRVLRNTLAQPQGWFKALGIPHRKASVEFAPSKDFLQPQSPQQIADFLNHF
jgi:CRISPR-associated protein Cmr1